MPQPKPPPSSPTQDRSAPADRASFPSTTEAHDDAAPGPAHSPGPNATHTPPPGGPPLSIGEALTMLEQALDITNGTKAHVRPLDLHKLEPAVLGWKGRDGQPQVLASMTPRGAELLNSWAIHGPGGLVLSGQVTNRATLVACSMPFACQVAALSNEEGVRWLSLRAIQGAEAEAILFAFCVLVVAVRAASFGGEHGPATSSPAQPTGGQPA